MTSSSWILGGSLDLGNGGANKTPTARLNTYCDGIIRTQMVHESSWHIRTAKLDIDIWL